MLLAPAEYDPILARRDCDFALPVYRVVCASMALRRRLPVFASQKCSPDRAVLPAGISSLGLRLCRGPTGWVASRRTRGARPKEIHKAFGIGTASGF